MIAISKRSLMAFTAYGMIRDQRTGNEMQAVAYMNGRLGRVNPTNFRKGDLFMHEYSIRGIMKYHLRVQTNPSQINDLEEVYYWDFFENSWKVDRDIDLMSQTNRLLAIGNVTGSAAIGTAGGGANV